MNESYFRHCDKMKRVLSEQSPNYREFSLLKRRPDSGSSCMVLTAHPHYADGLRVESCFLRCCVPFPSSPRSQSVSSAA